MTSVDESITHSSEAVATSGESIAAFGELITSSGEPVARGYMKDLQVSLLALPEILLNHSSASGRGNAALLSRGSVGEPKALMRQTVSHCFKGQDGAFSLGVDVLRIPLLVGARPRSTGLGVRTTFRAETDHEVENPNAVVPRKTS
jgi:hypothetical protein